MFRLRAPPASIAAIAVVGLSACVPVRSQLYGNVQRVWQQARDQWILTGQCRSHELQRCRNGRLELTASDGYSFWLTAYDSREALVYEETGGCTGSEKHGLAHPCRTPVLERDLCQEALATLDLRLAHVMVSCGPIRKTVEVARGGTARLELIEGAALQVRTSPRFEVAFDGAPAGIEMLECNSEACRALVPKQVLTSRVLSVTGQDRAKVDCAWAPVKFEFSESVDAGGSP